MDTYLTTYRKDYVWPYVTSVPITLGPPESSADARRAGAMECICRPGPTKPMQDPESYTAHVGAPPETDSSRHDQPNQYLKKLHEKYPFLYNVLQTHPPDDLIRRVYEDRFRTTYQVDYCKLGQFPADEYDAMLAAAGMNSSIGPNKDQCDYQGTHTKEPPGPQYNVQQKALLECCKRLCNMTGAQQPAAASPSTAASANCPCEQKCPPLQEMPHLEPDSWEKHIPGEQDQPKCKRPALPARHKLGPESKNKRDAEKPPVSEYKDTISKWGDIIMKEGVLKKT